VGWVGLWGFEVLLSSQQVRNLAAVIAVNHTRWEGNSATVFGPPPLTPAAANDWCGRLRLTRAPSTVLLIDSATIWKLIAVFKWFKLLKFASRGLLLCISTGHTDGRMYIWWSVFLLCHGVVSQSVFVVRQDKPIYRTSHSKVFFRKEFIYGTVLIYCQFLKSLMFDESIIIVLEIPWII
jgi:hypothetical protein